MNDYMGTRMKFLQRPVTTLKNRVAGIDLSLSQRPLNDPERPPTTLSFHLCHMETNKIPLATANDLERPAVRKFRAKSSNLNEDFKRPLTTIKDCQRH